MYYGFGKEHVPKFRFRAGWPVLGMGLGRLVSEFVFRILALLYWSRARLLELNVVNIEYAPCGKTKPLLKIISG